MRAPLISRILAAIAVALVASSLVAIYAGVKTEERIELSVRIAESGEAALIAVTPTVTDSKMKVTLANASEVRYLRVKADYRELLSGIADLRVVRELEMRVDLRSGVSHIKARVSDAHLLLSFLSMLGQTGAVQVADGRAEIDVTLVTGETLIIVARPLADHVVTVVEHTALGYDRLSLSQSIVLATTLLLASTVIAVASRRRG